MYNPSTLPTAPSYAALASLGLAASFYPYIYVLGGVNPSDGGQGTFYWDGASTLTPDNATIIQATGISTGRFLRQINNCEISSAWWLPDRTGLTDATAALQAGLNWCLKALDGSNPWNGQTYYIPYFIIEPGLYAITDSLTVGTGIAVRGRYHPCNTENSTRLIMNSTGITPARTWPTSTLLFVGAGCVPTVSNGFYYRMTTGNTTGSTEPTWPTTVGATVSDGSSVWTCTGVTVTTDNRNKPIFTYTRKSFTGNTLLNQFNTGSHQWLEHWYVILGATVANPLAGSSIPFGDYPNGACQAFTVDTGDFRIIECVYQHSPCAILCNAVAGTGPDGFTNSGVTAFFGDELEFDSGAAHIWGRDTQVGVNLNDSELFGSFRSGYFSGTANGQAILKDCILLAPTNSACMWLVDEGTMLDGFTATGCSVQRSNDAPTFQIRATFVDIKSNSFTGATNQSDIVLTSCKAGAVVGNSLDNSGYNASPSTNPATITSAIYLDGCGGTHTGLLVSGNSITDSLTGGAYNGYGIACVSVSGTSQNNVVVGNSVLANYDGTVYSGGTGTCWINIQAGDHRANNWSNGSFA